MTSTLSARSTDGTEPPAPEPPDRARAEPPPRSRRTGLVERASVGLLLAATAALYLWNLSASGWANAFYSAAAQAGGTSWTAWFFGSSDAANAITVDKTPAALWISGLAVRVFGLTSWSILVPQALMGVAAVGLLYATVRRHSGHAAGLLAGAALALTPVATLMFRFNNPDALLVLVLVAAAWATLRAVESGRGRWLVLAGVFVGIGFLAKMLQAFLVLPALAAAWLAFAPVGVGKRIRDLLAAGAALIVSAGWWVLVVELWPADSRPYIGGSQTNSVLELILGYNGFGRLTGDETGSVGGSPGGGWGQTGLTRLFTGEMAGEAGWLLPAALILLGALVWLAFRRRTTETTAEAVRGPAGRAAIVVWGGWLLVTGLVFSFMAGIFHSYYLVALAPPIAALVGMGTVELWRRRSEQAARIVLGTVVVVTAVWSAVLLDGWQPWLQGTLVVLGVAGAGALLGVHRMPRALRAAVVAAAVLAGLGGSAAWSVATAATPHTGAIPSSGPSGYGMGGMGGGPGGFGMRAGTAGPDGSGTGGTGRGPSAQGMPAPGGTGLGGQAGTAPGWTGQGGPGGTAQDGTTQGGGGLDGSTGGARRGGGMGSLLGTTTPSAAVTALLQQDASGFTWVAAAVGSNSAAGYQLAAGAPVMAVGGFNGTDPAPTLEQFQRYVAEGEIHWFVGGSGTAAQGSQTGGSDAAVQIAEWVTANFTPTTVDGVTLYDLSGGTTR